MGTQSILYADAIIFSNHPLCLGTKNLIAAPNPPGHGANILKHIPIKKLSGLRIIIEEILIFLSVSFIANYKQRRDILDILVPLYRVYTRLGFSSKASSTKKNGSEFTNIRDTKRVYISDAFCAQLNIMHKLIRPRSPWHNGKVEQSHRSDQERFFNHLKFYIYNDLKSQMKDYLFYSNKISMTVLNWSIPIQNWSSLFQKY